MSYSVNQIIKELKSKSNPKNLAGMARFGIVGQKRLGLSVPDMRSIAKKIGKDHELAIKLWKTGYAEAKIISAFIDDPEKLTEKQMDSWVKDMDSWDITDQVCMNLFDRSPVVLKKIKDWSRSNKEFIKRSAYALIASLAIHNKEASDDYFIKLFPIIKKGVTDERNFVKKAVNWALRQIGKRNLKLNKQVISLAKEIRKIDSKSAHWIANDAIRELEDEKVLARLKFKK